MCTSPWWRVRRASRWLGLPALLLVLAPGAPAAGVTPSPQTVWWGSLQALCGKAYAGTLAHRDEADAALDDWQGRLTAELDALRADALTQDATRFTPLLAGGRSISEKYARVREAVFGRTPGAPEPSP